MAKHINGYHEKKIVDVINTWSIDEKLTWDALCDCSGIVNLAT